MPGYPGAGRRCPHDAMPEGRIHPGRVFDRTVGLRETPQAYRAMAALEATKVLIKV